MSEANLKSKQECSKLEAMEEERKAHKENGLETIQRDFRKKETNRQEITGRTIGMCTVKL